MRGRTYTQLVDHYQGFLAGLDAARERGEITGAEAERRREAVEGWLGERRIAVPAAFQINGKIPGNPITLSGEPPPLG